MNIIRIYIKSAILLKFACSAKIYHHKLLPELDYGNSSETLLSYALRMFHYETHYVMGQLIAIICGKDEHLCDRFIQRLDLSQNLTMPYVITKGYDVEIMQAIGTSHLGYSVINVLIVDSENFQNIQMLVEHLNKFSFWSKREKTILIIPRIVDKSKAVVRHVKVILSYLWSLKIFNTLLVFWNEESLSVNCFTYTRMNNALVMNATSSIDRLLNSADTSNRSLFFDKLSREQVAGKKINVYSFGPNNRKYGINVTGSSYMEGSDAILIQAIEYNLNGHFQYFYFNNSLEDQAMYNKIFLDPTQMSSLERLEQFLIYTHKKYNIDLWYDANAIQDSQYLEGLYPHTKGDQYIILPGPYKISELYYLFLVVTPVVWAFIALHLLFQTAIITWSYNNEMKPKKTNLTFGLSLLNVFKMMFTNPTPLFLKSGPATRFLIISWFLFCFVVCGAAMSSLITVLVRPKYYDSIDTVQELATRKDYKIYAFQTTIDALEELWNNDAQELNVSDEKTTRIIKEFLKQLRPFTQADTLETFKLMCHWAIQLYGTMSYGFILSQNDAYKFITFCEQNYTKTIKNAPPIGFHIMKESPMPNLNSFNVPKGSIFKSKLDATILKTIESGIINRWERIRDEASYRVLNRKKSFFNDDEHVVLKVKHLQAAFCILLLGLGVAFGVFLGELHFAKVNKIRTIQKMGYLE